MSQERIARIRDIIEGHVKTLEDPKAATLAYLKTKLYAKLKPAIEAADKLFHHPEVDSVTAEQQFRRALDQYLTRNPVTVEPVNTISKKGLESWLTEKREEEIEWHYWNRYSEHLNKKGRSGKVVERNREACKDILGKMGDPTTPRFFRKGLVVGSVQSGKTENFNGVINHAIDAGYRLIIVLSGIMDDLRTQTQNRIEEDVIGWGTTDEESHRQGNKGVGNIVKFGAEYGTDTINSITSCKADFNRNLLDAAFSLEKRNILVCKKNVNILKNLLIWLDECLDGKETFDYPLLIVDDEADNASLNNLGAKGREHATKTNGHIRAILKLFERKTYLGYTATPFANVLQDRNEAPEGPWMVSYSRDGDNHEKRFKQVDNLFPDDFIVLLNPPSNYVGAKFMFETVEPINQIDEKLPIVVSSNDFVPYFPSRIDKDTGEGVEAVNSKDEFEKSSLVSKYHTWRNYRTQTSASKKDDQFPQGLPQSLKEAIACFIITIAVREQRAQRMAQAPEYCPHHTMLIHISRFIPWQNRTKKYIETEVATICERLMSDTQNEDDSIYNYFKKIWYKFYADIVDNIRNYLPKEYNDPYMAETTFKSILPNLDSAATDISIKALNSHPENRDSELKYNKKTPQKIIAIGGNRMSRGFTLEGLTINYFVRPAGCADTLLQMGRWFGYRTGYLDCCKIFTTPALVERFDLTTRTIEELEGEFLKMESQEKSPRNFELRVRKHPGALKITRPSILKNAKEVQWSYQDHLIQETTFSIKKADITKSWQSFLSDVVGPYTFHPEGNGDFWVASGLDGQDASKIIESIGNLDETTRSTLPRFIKAANEHSSGSKINNWKVAIKNTGQGRPLDPSDSGLPFKIENLAIRRGPKKGRLKDNFVNEKKFQATGKNRNIVSSGKDLALFLDDDERKEAEQEFIDERREYFLRRYPGMSPEDALKKAEGTTIPERIYREKMSDTDALIVIYLIDTKSVFLQGEGPQEPDAELKKVYQEEGVDLDIPLVGYAIGIPPIHPDPGGHYMKGEYDLEDDEPDELDEE